MYDTQEHDYDVTCGLDFDPTMYVKSAGVGVDLTTGWTVELVIKGVATLTDGDGLTLGADGRIDALMTGDTTARIHKGTHSWYLKLTNSDGRTGSPVKGVIRFKDL